MILCDAPKASSPSPAPQSVTPPPVPLGGSLVPGLQASSKVYGYHITVCHREMWVRVWGFGMSSQSLGEKWLGGE